METETIEIKIKQKGFPWEDTEPVLTMVVKDAKQANKVCEGIAKAVKKEVRWNFDWSAQGHYIWGE